MCVCVCVAAFRCCFVTQFLLRDLLICNTIFVKAKYVFFDRGKFMPAVYVHIVLYETRLP